MSLVNFPGTIPGVPPGYEDIDELKAYLDLLRGAINGGLDSANVSGLTDQVMSFAAAIADSKTALRPMCSVRRSTNQNMSSGATISYDTEMYDTAAMWSLAQPERLIAPVNGHYVATLCVATQANAEDPTVSIFASNGEPPASQEHGVNVAGQYLLNIGWEGELNAGDYVRSSFGHTTIGTTGVLGFDPWPFFTLRQASKL